MSGDEDGGTVDLDRSGFAGGVYQGFVCPLRQYASRPGDCKSYQRVSTGTSPLMWIGESIQFVSRFYARTRARDGTVTMFEATARVWTGREIHPSPLGVVVLVETLESILTDGSLKEPGPRWIRTNCRGIVPQLVQAPLRILGTRVLGRRLSPLLACRPL